MRVVAAGAKRQRGAALIIAMLLTGISAIIAASLISEQHIQVRRTANVLDGERAYVFALGVESWVKHLLARDARDTRKDSLDEDWAYTLPPITVESGQVAGRIEDMNGRFNLNNLLDAKGDVSQPDLQQFERLLDMLGLDMELSKAVLDWIDADGSTRFPGGAEDGEYMSGEMPYRAGNQPLVSISELMLVNGITPEAYQVLAPHVAALPQRTTVNVNTATAAVIASIAPGITLSDAEAIVETRDGEPFDSVSAFLAQGAFQSQNVQNNVDPNRLSVTTDYFLMDAATRWGDRGQARLYSLLHRQGTNVQVVWRAQGAY